MLNGLESWKHRLLISVLCLAGLPVRTLSGTESEYVPKEFKTGLVIGRFLTEGIGGPTDGMADARSAVPCGLSTLGGNPAHAALIGGVEVSAAGQRVNVLDRSLSLRTGYGSPRLGGLALGVEISGELSRYYNDCAVSLTYGRMFGKWIAAGVTVKGIWIDDPGEDIRGAAWDAGMLVLPNVLSRTGKREDGLKIGASLANQKLGRLHNELNYMLYEVWDYYPSVGFPSVLRVGLSVVPVAMASNRLTLAFDAVHPDGDEESFNYGVEDRVTFSNHLGVAFRYGLAFRYSDNYATAGIGIFRPISNGRRLEAGYSWMRVPDSPDRHGIYMRLYQ